MFAFSKRKKRLVRRRPQLVAAEIPARQHLHLLPEYPAGPPGWPHAGAIRAGGRMIKITPSLA